MASRIFPSDSDALESIVTRILAQACFCLPGIVEEFDAGPPQLTKVYPAIKRKITEGHKAEYVPMPVLLNVPIVVPFAQTAGLLLTLPIKKGDEGLIIFADRMIDNFVEKGGCQPPECCGGDNKTTEPRAHSLTDAIFIPGVISKPWGKKIAEWNMEAVEIRNLDRTAFISLGTDKNILIQTTGNITAKCQALNANVGGDASVKAGGAVRIDGSEIRLNEG